MSGQLKELANDFVVKSYLIAIQKYKQFHGSSAVDVNIGSPSTPSPPVENDQVGAFRTASGALGPPSAKPSTALNSAAGEITTNPQKEAGSTFTQSPSRLPTSILNRPRSSAHEHMPSRPVTRPQTVLHADAFVSGPATGVPLFMPGSHKSGPQASWQSAPTESGSSAALNVKQSRSCFSPLPGTGAKVQGSGSARQNWGPLKLAMRPFGSFRQHIAEPWTGTGIPAAASSGIAETVLDRSTVCIAGLQQQQQQQQQLQALHHQQPYLQQQGQQDGRRWDRRPPPPPPPPPPLLPWALIVATADVDGYGCLGQEIHGSFSGKAQSYIPVSSQAQMYGSWPCSRGYGAYGDYGQAVSSRPWQYR
ncbi:hypothetical protein VaNZ11_004605 [Volvox africanus]|uniref:Uncharacterized protein n=1 Tax=Volvox africanus TaxID=51714 RepID=A0ABQ5RWL4_9CHLO|nr:hypothetical protein VaNZ11_004605 [Volvox africanus]